MTNGEMIQKVFNCEVCEPIIEDDIIHVIFADKKDSAIGFDWSWWNAEYKEPTTKNDLPHCQHTDEEIAKSFIEDVEAVKDQSCGEQMDFPSTFDEFAKDYGFKDKDEVYTNGSELIPVFRVKQWLEHISTTKNDIRDNRVKNELNRVKNELEPTTKNNLGVDCISREQALVAIRNLYPSMPRVDFNGSLRKWVDKYKPYIECDDAIKQLPSVTLQLSSELEKNSKKLEKDFGESDCISRADAIRVASGYCHPSNVAKELAKLPSVTSIRPKGYWIYKKFDERTGMTNVHICSKCGCPLASPYKSFCSACGSDNREVEE